MADFTVRPTSGNVLTLDWLDLPASRPSRLNPYGIPHRRFKIALGTGIYGGYTTFAATPSGGTEGAADGTLGGRLFTSWVGEQPPAAMPIIISPVGFTSIVGFQPDVIGHYMIVMRRTGGGAVGIHIDVEAT